MTTDLARWQFATTSIYHFLFVPGHHRPGLPGGAAPDQLVPERQPDVQAAHQVLRDAAADQRGRRGGDRAGPGVRVRDELVELLALRRQHLRRAPGHGGPGRLLPRVHLLGLWIFGWDRLSKKVHLACIWLVAAATMLSALFIMAANSWMQHPVGYVMNAQHQPQLNDIWALFTNPVFLWAYPHVVLASLVTGAIVMLAVSAWHLRRKRRSTPSGARRSSRWPCWPRRSS